MKVVIDTNVILHGKWLEDLLWKDILNKVPNEILIPYKVLQELDEKKFDPKHCERAKKRLKNLYSLINKKIKSKTNISYGILKTSFSAGESKQGLNLNSADDCILNGILKYEEKNKSQKVILLTFDYSFSLKASAHSVKVKILDSKYYEIDDSKGKEIKKIKSELTTLKNRIPKLKICFEDKKTEKIISFNYKRVLDSYEKISEYKSNLLNKYPPLTHPDSRPSENKSKINLGELSKALERIAEKMNPLLTPSKEEYERYSKEREVYIEKIDLHIKDIQKYDEIHSRAFEFKLLINNIGTCPASSVSVDLYFPNGFKLIDLDRDTVDEIEHPPEPPDPPKKPTPPFVSAMSAATNNNFKSFDYFSTLSIPRRHHKTQNIRPTIEKINSYKFKHPSVDEIIHHNYFSLGRFKIFFDSHKDIKSFQVNCKVHCREFLKPEEQKLHFIIKNV